MCTPNGQNLEISSLGIFHREAARFCYPLHEERGLSASNIDYLYHTQEIGIQSTIIEYGSTLYVGMAQKKNGGPYKYMASVCTRTDINVSLELFKHAWQRLPNRFMFKTRKNIGTRLSRAASQHGSNIGLYSFFSRPSATTLEAMTIIST